jgi:hypothetical protein
MTTDDDGDDGELTEEQFERRQELIERLLELLTDDTLREDTEDAIEASQEYGPLSLTQLTASEALNEAHSALQTFKHAQSVAVMLQTLGLEDTSFDDDLAETEEYLTWMASAARWLSRRRTRLDALDKSARRTTWTAADWAQYEIPSDDDRQDTEDHVRNLLRKVRTDDEEDEK